MFKQNNLSSFVFSRRTIRYAATSAVAVVVSFTTIALLYDTALVTNFSTATLLGNLTAMVPSYFMHRYWVWAKRGPSHLRKEVTPYVTTSALGIGFSMLAASLLHHAIITHHLSTSTTALLLASTNFMSFALLWFIKLAMFHKIFTRV